jgi:hypothetical protein
VERGKFTYNFINVLYPFMEERRGAYWVLVGKPERMRQLGTPRRGYKDNIKINLTEVGWGHGLDGSGSG